MLSLEHCRKVLGPDVKLSNEELATLREQLYGWASLALDMRDHCKTSGFDKATSLLSDPDSIAERAAILEFEAKLSRDEAERSAISLSIQGELLN